jgi:hypothetical protein
MSITNSSLSNQATSAHLTLNGLSHLVMIRNTSLATPVPTCL